LLKSVSVQLNYVSIPTIHAMTTSTDVGSLPFPKKFDEDRFLRGCELFERGRFQPRSADEDEQKYFERIVCNGFIGKIASGIDIPCYPQYRDMITQFTGFYKIHEGYFTSMSEELLSEQGYNPQYTFIAEVDVLKKYAEQISEMTGRGQVEFKACLTSPLDLSFKVSTDFLISMARNAVIDSKYLKTRIVTFDMPSFGYQMVWDRAIESCKNFFDGVKSTGRNVETALHLHSGNHRDLLEIESLDIFEFHSQLLENPPVAERELERYDKFLQIGVASTANLVELEPISTIRKRLKKAVDMFGNRVKYISPDCGLKGLDSHERALKLMRMISEVARETSNSQ